MKTVREFMILKAVLYVNTINKKSATLMDVCDYLQKAFKFESTQLMNRVPKLLDHLVTHKKLIRIDDQYIEPTSHSVVARRYNNPNKNYKPGCSQLHRVRSQVKRPKHRLLVDRKTPGEAFIAIFMVSLLLTILKCFF